MSRKAFSFESANRAAEALSSMRSASGYGLCKVRPLPTAALSVRRRRRALASSPAASSRRRVAQIGALALKLDHVGAVLRGTEQPPAEIIQASPVHIVSVGGVTVALAGEDEHVEPL